MDDKHLDQQSAPRSQDYASSEEDEIDLRELLGIIWADRALTLGVTTLFAVCSIFYALSLTNVYRAEAIIVQANAEQSAGLYRLRLGRLGIWLYCAISRRFYLTHQLPCLRLNG